MNLSALGSGGFGGMPDFSRLQDLRQQAFNKADVDGSGGLSIAEFQGLEGPGGAKPSEAQAEEAFKAFDGDGDGQLTQRELDDGLQKMMQSLSTQGLAGFSGFAGGPPQQAQAGGETLQQLQSLLAALEQGSTGEEQRSSRASTLRLLA
jgi:hypothetical protein